MRSVKKLFYTTVALTLTGFLMKTVAVWFNAYLTGLVGSAGIGVFQLILSVYTMAKTLAYAGMNLGATRLCVDDFKTARHSVLRIELCALFMGTFANILLFFLAPFLSRVWMDAPEAASSLKVLSFSLPFVSMSAGIHGYMTAARKMSRYSVIQLLEQLCRIGSTVLLVHAFGIQNDGKTLYLVSAGITISEVFSYALCLITYRRDVAMDRMPSDGKPGFLKRFCRIAVPDALGAYMRSALNTVEHLLIPWGIRRSGVSTEKAFSAYGIVQGMALPVLLYPSAILSVVSSLLVPEIAECKVKKNEVEVNYIVNRVLQIAMLFSLGCSIAMFLFAEPLSLAIFHSAESAPFLRLLAPLVPIMFLDMTTDGMLKGLDQQLAIMKINVLDSVLCVILVYFLVPVKAVDGYLITIYAAEIINFLLSFRKLCKEVKLEFHLLRHIFFPPLCAILSFGVTLSLFAGITETTPRLVIALGAGSILYYALLRLSGSVSKDDARWARGLFTP